MQIKSKSCKFETARLLVAEWHAISPSDQKEQDLARIISTMLTPSVTQSLPEAWHGEFTVERARQWISERDREGTALLVVERLSKSPVGLMILYETDEPHIGRAIRLGYLLAESVWGQGLASELIQAFVDWCNTAGIKLLIGGIERNNIASQRVLEKCGFVSQTGDKEGGELVFELWLQSETDT